MSNDRPVPEAESAPKITHEPVQQGDGTGYYVGGTYESPAAKGHGQKIKPRSISPDEVRLPNGFAPNDFFR